jgi:ATP-binding cassette, subfamily B, bacterial MsbA
LKDILFRDTNTITRGADELQVEYTTWHIVGRIWREHLRPRIGLLLIASAAMLLTAATTGAIPFLIQRTADDVFVGKSEQMVYWITAAIVIVTVVKACAEYVADVTVAYLGHRFVADLRIQMFAKLARADLNWIPGAYYRASSTIPLSSVRRPAAPSSRSARITSRSSS